MKELLAHLVGDYVVQSHWEAVAKTDQSLAAAAHATGYTLCFLPLTRDPRSLAIIGGTHYLVDRYRLARYLVWAKNQAAPKAYRYPFSESESNGYPSGTPAWLGTWLMIIADNTAHMVINHLALKIGDRR